MRRIKRVLHTLNRFRHGRGFGVHSPFAFNFILKTLRERTPYYAYPALDSLRRSIKHDCRARHLMSGKHMRMLFRIVNRFNPGSILMLGSLQGEELGPLLEPDSNTLVSVCAPVCEYTPQLLEKYSERIDIKASFPQEIESEFVIIGMIDDCFLLQVEDLLRRRLLSLDGHDMVIVFPHMRTNAIRRLWKEVRTDMQTGMAFYNEKSFAVAVVHNRLPRQDFRVSL